MAPSRTRGYLPAMAILSHNDHELLDRFLNRVLNRYAKEGRSLIDARSDLAHVVAAVDRQSAEAVQFMRDYLEHGDDA